MKEEEQKMEEIGKEISEDGRRTERRGRGREEEVAGGRAEEGGDGQRMSGEHKWIMYTISSRKRGKGRGRMEQNTIGETS